MMVWIHNKTKGLYRIVTTGLLESDGTPHTVYQCIRTGVIWIRPSSEFHDGRFLLQTENIVQ
jgi:hypothetical protein